MKELSDLEKHYLRVLLRKETPIKEEAKSLYRLWKEARKGKIHSKECNKIDNDLRTLISYAFVFHGSWSWQSKRGSNGSNGSNGKIKRRVEQEEKALGLIVKRLESELNQFRQIKNPTDFEKGKHVLAMEIYEMLNLDKR